MDVKFLKTTPATEILEFCSCDWRSVVQSSPVTCGKIIYSFPVQLIFSHHVRLRPLLCIEKKKS